MKRLSMAVVLAFVISGSVFAGEMPTCGAPAPATTHSSAVVTVVLTLLSTIVS